MSKIPDNLLYSLHSISGKGVDTAGIKFHTLKCLRTSDCKNLQSLPELTFGVDYLHAEGCTSLENVSRSSTAILQGALPRDQQLSFLGDCVLFLNCLKLSETARSNIIADGQLRILRMATEAQTRAFKKWDVNKPEELCYVEDASICYPGNEVPEWYDYQATGSSIKIIPPPYWLDSTFLGFSLCFVAAFKDYDYSRELLDFLCEFHLKTDTNESLQSNYALTAIGKTMVDGSMTTIVNSDHVFMMYEHRSLSKCKALEGTIIEVSFHFKPAFEEDYGNKTADIVSCKVKRCGIRLLYRQEADKNFVSNPDYWKSIEDHYARERPSGSDRVLDYSRENEEEERPNTSEIVQEFGSTCDDELWESTAKEDDVINNNSTSSGSRNLYQFEAKDNVDESKSLISSGYFMFLSHIREWIFRKAV